MANFLENDESIQGKWGPPPRLEAANIGTTLAAILHDRLERQKMMGADISSTIKNVMANRQRDAYTEALRNAGLTQGQDISGLSDSDATRLATLIQAQTPDTQMDEYHKALTRQANATADMYSKYPGGGGGDDSQPETVGPDENGIIWRKHYDAKGRVNYYPVKPAAGPKAQTQGDLKSELANVGVTGEGMSKSEEQYGVLPSGERVPKDRPWTDAGTIYVPSAEGSGKVPMTIEKFRHLKKALGIPDPDPTPAPSPTPGATPGQTPSASAQPSATPRPTVGLASGYGTPAGGSGTGQVGELVEGHSKRFVNGKSFTWWGARGWLPD